MLLRREIGAHQAEDPVGLVGIRGPDLLAADHKMVALILGARLQRGQVGAGVGFGIALAPADFAARNPGQVFALLRLGAIFQQRGPEHGDAEALQRHAAMQPLHLGAQHPGLGRAQPRATILAWPFRNRPALFGHPLQPQPLRFRLVAELAAAPADVFLVLHRQAHFRGAIGLQPGVCLLPERFQCVQARLLVVRLWARVLRCCLAAGGIRGTASAVSFF
ncbi:hypothetical protein D3C81_1371920 [compost metagenome]